jgi:outer membrane protein assembly factor BamB
MRASNVKTPIPQDAKPDSICASAPSRLCVSLTWTVWIAAAFCLLVCATMLYQHSVAAQRDPWKSPQLLKLKAQLRGTPNDEALKNEIRRLDFEFRQRYVRRLSLDRTGGWLLVGGMAVMLLAAKQASKLQAQPWLPKPKPAAGGEMRQLAARSRWSVAAISIVVLAGLGMVAFTARSPLPTSAVELDKLLGRGPATEGVAAIVSLAEFQANWPRFRGFDGGGVSTQTNVPLTWDGKSGTGIAWKSPLPAPGHSSPVVWSNRVFVSGGDATKRGVFCFDAADGKLLWQRTIENVPGSPAKQPEIPEMTGFASPTMACDGRRVFAIFANGDLVAFTLDGAPVWSKNIGVPKNAYGYAASLAVWPGKLIVQLDQDDGAPGGSKLMAFDCANGRPLWQRGKPTHDSWASPIIIQAAGKTQIITLAVPFVISYSLTDGTELWRAELLAGEVTPSPIFADGLVIVVNPSTELVAVKPDGAGDVTKTRIAWRAEDNVPDVTSPVSNGGLVFTIGSMGMLTCLDAKDGKKIWEHDLDMEVQSSPAIVGERLFILGTKGVGVVVEAGREFKELARSQLADEFLASPAFSSGRMYLRGTTNLWCLGKANHK